MVQTLFHFPLDSFLADAHTDAGDLVVKHDGGRFCTCVVSGRRLRVARQQGLRTPGLRAHSALPAAKHRAPFDQPLLPAVRAPALPSFAHSEGLERSVSGLDSLPSQGGISQQREHNVDVDVANIPAIDILC
jgi:hypothetical protein